MIITLNMLSEGSHKIINSHVFRNIKFEDITLVFGLLKNVKSYSQCQYKTICIRMS